MILSIIGEGNEPDNGHDLCGGHIFALRKQDCVVEGQEVGEEGNLQDLEIQRHFSIDIKDPI